MHEEEKYVSNIKINMSRYSIKKNDPLYDVLIHRDFSCSIIDVNGVKSVECDLALYNQARRVLAEKDKDAKVLRLRSIYLDPIPK